MQTKNYFVTVNNKEITNNCTKQQAINRAIKESHNVYIGGINIGIGKIKQRKGKKIFTHLPYYFYLNE